VGAGRCCQIKVIIGDIKMDINSESGGQAKGQAPVAVNRRLMSLDALRGFDMFWITGGWFMVHHLDGICNHHPVTAFIKNQLEHVVWEGFRFEDIIMPLFLFIVGTAMPFSFSKSLAGGRGKKQIYLHVVKRVLILWILGMMLQGNLLSYRFSGFRFYSNTLQAIAAGYLFASIIMLQSGIRWQIIITGGLLLLYWALLALVPVPGYGPGVLTADGNFANYIDHMVLGRFDDGLNYTWVLSSMTFTATVMLGVMAGHLLRSKKTETLKTLGLFAAGIGLLLLGMAWDIWFPIIKRIWTSSFVLFSGGLCYLLLAVFYLVIDVWGFKKWAFGFVVIGTNAIAIYVTYHLFDFREVADIFVRGLARWLNSDWYELVRALLAFAIAWLILYWMYRKKTFIKI
jgi:predicted acyltransferase